MANSSPIATAQRQPWVTASAAAGGLAAAMGVGRFAYTPLLPIMTASAGLTPSGGAVIATTNYAGYLVGAVAVSLRRGWATRRAVVIGAAALLVVSEFAMSVGTDTALWALLRFAAGVCSAGLFVACAQRISRIPARSTRTFAMFSGLAFSGVGAGIALTGIIVAVLGPHLTWRELWLVLAAVSLALLTPLLITLPAAQDHQSTSSALRRSSIGSRRSPRRFDQLPLAASYFLEGVGYIIVGTFLVASVVHTAGPTLGPIAWIVVGVAAAPGTLAWSHIGHRIGSRRALVGALVVQAGGAGVFLVSGTATAAIVAAALFGATFMGITALTMQIGVEMRGPNAAGPLTAIYAGGQMLGPLIVIPVIATDYTTAFAVAAATMTIAAALAVIVRRAQLAHLGASGLASRDEPG